MTDNNENPLFNSLVAQARPNEIIYAGSVALATLLLKKPSK